MHREVSPLVRPRVFPLVPLHCHSLCLASTSSRGLGFVGIIPLSKNSAPNPDVCRSNLNLEGWRGGGGQSRAVTTPWPSLALPGWFPTASAPTAAPGAALIPAEGQDGCTGISIRGEAPEACLGGSWAGIWGAGRFVPPGRGQNTLTACWKSVDMPMLSSTLSRGRFSFSHTSCRRDSSTCRARGDSRGSHLGTAMPALCQDATHPDSCLALKSPAHRTSDSHAPNSTWRVSRFTDRTQEAETSPGAGHSNCCPAEILAAASEGGWEQHSAERSVPRALTLALRALHHPAQAAPTS